MKSENSNFLSFNGRDEFRREKIAEKVIQLLTSSIDVSPMVIDGGWGTGKTEFCHKLINKFKVENEKFRLLYIDCFQADHADNPLLTILSGVMSLLPEGSDKKNLLAKILPVARFSFSTAGKAVITHLLKQNADELAEGLEKHLQTAADQAIDVSIKALLKDHQEAEKNLQALQTTLAAIASDNPIVIFVDELDRCRPDFAVQMLEVIKHTFNVDGVKFVLVTNTQQLRAAINHRYGDQVDAQRYLDKFLKFSFRLSEFVLGQVSDKSRLLAAVEHFSRLVIKSTVLRETGIAERGNVVSKFTKQLIQQNNLSLREVETFVRHLEIYQALGKQLGNTVVYGYVLLRIFGIFIFCFKPSIAYSLEKNKSDADDVSGVLGVSKLPNPLSNEYERSMLVSVAVMLAQSSNINHERYVPTSREEQEYWDDDMQRYFAGGWGAPDDIHAPVKEAIRSLQLSIIS